MLSPVVEQFGEISCECACEFQRIQVVESVTVFIGALDFKKEGGLNQVGKSV